MRRDLGDPTRVARVLSKMSDFAFWRYRHSWPILARWLSDDQAFWGVFVATLGTEVAWFATDAAARDAFTPAVPLAVAVNVTLVLLRRRDRPRFSMVLPHQWRGRAYTWRTDWNGYLAAVELIIALWLGSSIADIVDARGGWIVGRDVAVMLMWLGQSWLVLDCEMMNRPRRPRRRRRSLRARVRLVRRKIRVPRLIPSPLPSPT